MNKEQCRQGEWNTMRWTNRSKENEWALIYSNQVMENSQIANVCNDGEDNDPKSLGKGHLSLIRKIHNEIDTRKWESPESSHRNSHKQLTKKRQLSMTNIYTQWRMTLYTGAYYLFLFFSFFHFFSFFFSFTCAYSEYK